MFTTFWRHADHASSWRFFFLDMSNNLFVWLLFFILFGWANVMREDVVPLYKPRPDFLWSSQGPLAVVYGAVHRNRDVRHIARQLQGTCTGVVSSPQGIFERSPRGIAAASRTSKKTRGGLWPMHCAASAKFQLSWIRWFHTRWNRLIDCCI